MKPKSLLVLPLSLALFALSGSVQADDAQYAAENAQMPNAPNPMLSQTGHVSPDANAAKSDVANSGNEAAPAPAPVNTEAKMGVDTDAHILTKLHLANQDEIKMGKLAQDNSSSPQVKAYGKKLVSDHQLVDRRLYDLAAREKIVLGNPPLTMNDQEKKEMQDNQNTIDKLSSLSGAEFDRAFRGSNDHRS